MRNKLYSKNVHVISFQTLERSVKPEIIRQQEIR
jgi:hypothetical protein